MDILKPGYLTDFAGKILMGTTYNNKQKLTTAQLLRISTIYGHLAYKYNLYDLLFVQDGHELEVDGSKIHTYDLKMFALMDWSCVRFKFWRPDTGKATTDTGVCAGVPLALAGARRVYNKSYMSWIPDKDSYKTDIFLPNGLNSWELNDKGSFIKAKHPGLLAFYRTEGLVYDLNMVHKLRKALPGYASHKQDVLEPNLLGKYGELYNKAAKPMRSLLTQGWCWTSACRCTDMITDYRDWDNYAESADTSLTGLIPTPTTLPKGIQEFVGHTRGPTTTTLHEELQLMDKTL